MQITKQDVELAAKLAKMKVSEQEVAIYEEQLKALFDWVAELSAVNTESVQLTGAQLAAFIRPDEPVQNAPLAQELRNDFACEQDGCAKVKKVL
ncbi:MAG: aspartyl/glutamyl-tRNA amidotransferase subunit C [Elusimicrobiaceae bacterium]|nr:aspartyl/glutamyl-tRNA amidotransferase subunit C [Elusimicrobiaceae bacterium]